jgi:alpha-mannosidase
MDRRLGDVVLSAIKQAENRPTVIVRLFNPGDDEAAAVLSFEHPAPNERPAQRESNGPIAHAFEVNLLEERQGELAVSGGAVSVRLQPHKILTVELSA